MIDEKEIRKLITTADAARLLGVTSNAVRYLCRAGRIANCQVVGRVWMIDPASLRNIVRLKPGRKG